MATTRPNSAFIAILDAIRTHIDLTVDEMKDALAKRKIYHETYAKLSAMSDRNLKDIGISRSGIERTALEAAGDY